MKGSVAVPAGEKGYLIGGFLPPSHSFYSNKMEIAYREFSADFRGDRHSHVEVDEAVIVLAGGYDEIEVNGEVMSVGKGEFLFIRSGSVVELKRVQKDTLVLAIKAPSRPDDKQIVPRNKE